VRIIDIFKNIQCQNVFQSTVREGDEYKELWTAVIRQAFQDLKYKNAKRTELRIAFDSSIHFFNNKLYMTFICSYLDLDPDVVYQRFLIRLRELYE
jgi:hypothetical protein